MLDLESAKPLYEQIKDYLMNNIRAGVFNPGDRIPSERSLSEQFGVSRLTVKRAIDDLTQDGLLLTRVGKGTYLTTPKVNMQLEQLTSFTEEMAQRGGNASSRVLHKEMIRATEEDAQVLTISPGAPIALLVRLRLTNGVPMAIERTKLVAGWFRGLLELHDFSQQSLYAVLQVYYGMHLRYAKQSMEARLATEEESRLLEIEPKAPILHMTRVTYTDFDQAFEYTLSAYSGTRYKFNAILNAT